jgi:GNAT superfamily N-acetyltransferase
MSSRLRDDSTKRLVLKMNTEFRIYRSSDRDGCLALFDANCPAFFAPNERQEYDEFLSAAGDAYTVCLLDGDLVGAYGVEPREDAGLALRWILLSPAVQGRGLGSRMMARMAGEARARGASHVEIAASDKSAPFFARFGAREVRTIPDGWGPSMDRVDMLLTL